MAWKETQWEKDARPIANICVPGYDRGQPLSFKVGSGQVIKGSVSRRTMIPLNYATEANSRRDIQLGRRSFGHVHWRKEVRSHGRRVRVGRAC
jgi:hypothetical protein